MSKTRPYTIIGTVPAGEGADVRSDSFTEWVTADTPEDAWRLAAVQYVHREADELELTGDDIDEGNIVDRVEELSVIAIYEGHLQDLSDDEMNEGPHS